jgi:hypothetical protein
MRPYRIGTRSGTRVLACSSRMATGSGRSSGGAHCAWIERGTSPRFSRPLERHSSGVSTSCGGARTPGETLLMPPPTPDHDRRRQPNAPEKRAWSRLYKGGPTTTEPYVGGIVTHSPRQISRLPVIATAVRQRHRGRTGHPGRHDVAAGFPGRGCGMHAPVRPEHGMRFRIGNYCIPQGCLRPGFGIAAGSQDICFSLGTAILSAISARYAGLGRNHSHLPRRVSRSPVISMGPCPSRRTASRAVPGCSTC